MKQTFASFDLGIDYLFPSEAEERKQKKEEQHCFACIGVSKLDNLVKGAQAKTTICNKIRSKHFQHNFCI